MSNIDFKDLIKGLGERVVKLKEQVTTEEATKNAFIMPFIQCLGYDVFNPTEVIPEFVADLGIKQGEKVDYSIFKNGLPIILIECKWHGHTLDVHNSQLFRYFHTTKAKFGLLTNGIEYRFYTDLVEPNKMDEKPFFVFNITDIKDAQIEELKKFHKAYYDFETIVSTASDLKYTNEIKLKLAAELTNPSEEFIRFIAKQIYSGTVTSKVVEKFSTLIKKSYAQYINDSINERLKAALQKEAENQIIEEKASAAPEDDQAAKINTTAEELEAFYIVKSIIRKNFDSSRIGYKDAQTYFVILLDNNVRRYICRLYLQGPKKFIGLFDANKTESKVEIQKLDDLYALADKICQSAENVIKGKQEQ